MDDKSKPNRDEHDGSIDGSADEFSTLPSDAGTSGEGSSSPAEDEFATFMSEPGSTGPGDNAPPELNEPAETVDLHSTDEATPPSAEDSLLTAATDNNLHEPDATIDGSESFASDADSFAGTKSAESNRDDDDLDDVGGATIVGDASQFEETPDEFAEPEATVQSLDSQSTNKNDSGAAPPEDDEFMATFVSTNADDLAEPNSPSDTMQMVDAPDFEDPSDELMQTQRADPILLDKLAAGDAIDSSDDLDATAKTFAPTKTPTEATMAGGMASDWAGKSQWDLRIHRRDVRGTLSGIPNKIPRSIEEAVGLQSAFIDDNLVSDYEIVNELGAGNMGVVYRARQTSLNRELAIKTLKPKKGSGSQSTLDSQQRDYEQEMFVSEAVVTSNLVHPNIVPIHDLARNADGKLFYAMKVVTGTPWNKTIRKPGSLEDKLDILMKVCDGVGYAHSKGVINRDLKPENVVVGDYGEVMVLDWGLAITTDRFTKKGSVLTDVRGGAGTPVYMPPEQFDRDTHRVGYHSDIYLLGAILFEILEGFPPHYLRRLWKADKGTNKFNAIVHAVINNEIEQDVTECELMNIALKAMSTNPADRYQTVEEFQTAIREYRITGRAEEMLAAIETEQPTDYSKHQAAVALFDEAHAKWPENERAHEGGRRARLAYASLAVDKSDLDLASQVVEGQDGSDFETLRKRISSARRRQLFQKVALAVFFFATIGFGAFSYITKQDLIAKDKRLQNVDAEIASAEMQKADAQKAAEDALAEATRAEAEAAKAKAEAMVALEEAETAKSEAMLAQANAKKAATAAKLAQADALKATEEATKAKQETMVAEQAAKKSQMDAAKALEESKIAQAAADKAKLELATAEKAVTKATADAMAAQKEAMLAKADAVKVKKEAEIAVAKLSAESKQLTQQIAVSKQEQAELQAEVYKSEYLVHKRYIDAYTELGEYGSAARQIDDALADEKNVEIQKRAANLRRWQNELRRREGSKEVTFATPIETGAVSVDGSAIATYSADDAGQPVLTIVDNDTEQTLANPAADLTALVFSPDGQILAGVGQTSQQLWVKNTDQWTAVSLQSANQDSVEWLKPVFTDDSQYLLLVGADKSGTIDIVDCNDLEAPSRTRITLAGRTDADYSLHDVAISSEKNFLIASTKRQSCRCFPIEWKDRIPTLAKSGPNAPAIRLPIRPEIIRIAPGGQFVAMSEGRELIVLPRRDVDVYQSFPFEAPSSTTATSIECRIAITDLAFSENANRLAAGLREKFIQVWDRRESNFAASTIDGLYKGQFLAGHSGGIRSIRFAADNQNTLVSVASDNAVRRWKLSDYAEYVSHFEALPELLEEPPTDTSTSRIVNPDDLIPIAFEIENEHSAKKKEVRFRQGRTANSSRFSTDGQRVIVGSDDRAAHVFETATGQDTMANRGDANTKREGRVSLFFDPYRNAFLEGHIPQLSSVQFLPPNGELLLTADYFGSISVWDASVDDSGVGFEVSRLLSEYSLSEFATSADGQLVIAGGAVIEPTADDRAKTRLRHFGLVWRIDDIRSSPTPQPFLKLEGEHPRNAITAVAISPTGRFAATAGRRGRIVMWDLQTGESIAKVPSSHGADQVSGLAFVTDSIFLSTGFDGRIFSWERSEERLISTAINATSAGSTPIDAPPANQSKPNFIVRLRQKPDRTGFVTSAVHSRRDPKNPRQSINTLVVEAWSGSESQVLLREPLPEADQSKAFRHDLGWSSDGTRLLFVLDGRLTVFDTSTWKPISSFNDGGLGTTRAAFAAAEGPPTRIASFDGEVTHLWDLATGQHVAEFRSHASVFAAAFASDRRFVATASDSIRVFHADESSPLHGQTVMRLHSQENSPIADVAFTPATNSYQLASIDELGTVALWNWAPGQAVPEKPTTTALPSASENPGLAGAKIDNTARNAVAYSPTGSHLAALQFGKLRLWNIDGAKLTEVPISGDHTSNLTANSIAWSHDGRRLVAAGFGNIASSREKDSLGLVFAINPNESAAAEIGTFSGGHVYSERSDTTATGVTAVAVDTTGDILTGGDRGEILRWGVLESVDNPAIEIEPFGQLALSDGRRPHEGTVLSIDTAQDGAITSSGSNGFVVIWPAN